ncbi:MAG: hypothetical protein Q8K43_07130, partial [Sulfurimicrobium sp.]|nr:hypothetical protein [Sulfurimicrobium sp.]
MTASKSKKPQAEFSPDNIDNLGLHILFGCGGKTLHRRDSAFLLLGKFPDESNGVEVIRAKIMSPLGQT